MKPLKVMKDHTEQHLDKLAKKVMRSSSLESPSMYFTANIMTKVEAYATSDITVYKPLISKKSWLIIFVLVVGGLSYGFFGNGVESLGWFDKIDYSIISNNKITEAISGITISKTLMYAIGFFGLVFFIQIPMMKHYFDKRLAL
jgi:hypothetical protein